MLTTTSRRTFTISTLVVHSFGEDDVINMSRDSDLFSDLVKWRSSCNRNSQGHWNFQIGNSRDSNVPEITRNLDFPEFPFFYSLYYVKRVFFRSTLVSRPNMVGLKCLVFYCCL